jgi:transcriptional regulator with XRE-family HTH domain
VSHAKRKLTYEQQLAQLIGQRIRERRKSLGYSQQALTDRINQHSGGMAFYRELLSRIEVGRSLPTIVLLLILTEKLDVNWDYWFEDLEQD